MAALVMFNKYAVDPDPGFVIHCAKMEVDPLALERCRDGESAFIPDSIVEIVGADAAQFALEAKRYFNFLGKSGILIPFRGIAYLLVVEIKVPGSVQTKPVIADKLGTGIFFPVGHIVRFSNLS